MNDIAQQIPRDDCGHDTVHPALAPESMGSFWVMSILSPQRVSEAQRHPFVLRPANRGLNIIAARSIGRLARPTADAIP
jgi:hypothetical protein